MTAEKVLHFIVGKHTSPENGNWLDLIDPSSGEVTGQMAKGGAAEAMAAVKEARTAMVLWRTFTGAERAAILRKISGSLESQKKDLASLITLEVGKPIKDSRYEVERAISLFLMAGDSIRHLTGETYPADAYALPPGNDKRIIFTVREPVGVVVAISPFNFPLNLLSHKVAPALAAGNTVVAKPSSNSPRVAVKLAEIAHEAGVPPGVFNVVLGSGEEVGLPLVSHPAVRLVTFTGSTSVGRRIGEKAGHSSKRTILEMGGMDAEIVFSDADIKVAAAAAAKGCFGYSGQVCTATKRILVEEPVAEQFTKEFVEIAKGLKVGDPTEDATEIGPLIDGQAVERIDSMVKEATLQGATLLAGGSPPDQPRRGNFYLPTVILNPPIDSRVIQEEPFGPIAPIMVFGSEEEAIEAANATRYGLQASIYTPNIAKALRVARQLNVGGVHINDPTNLRWDALPFGGVRASGIGREGIDEAIREMTEVKTVSINYG